ncbi:hypothetical protein [Methylocucumis oryzae]|uniref:Uncharacterized protein n=1 Tax=Methylocucumis oryzae TaxID=1632867 RepID=A0A0F3ILN9_9GAMM|nr:hypothetical protein [Methylocucumis oryzae]KJV06479.1 hypothetical protein VZ94_10935 [Methylocucumis oryzae]
MENFNRYWQWWLHELDQLLPNWFKTVFYPYRQQQLFVRFENFQAHIFSLNNGAETKIGQFFLHKEGNRQLKALF